MTALIVVLPSIFVVEISLQLHQAYLFSHFVYCTEDLLVKANVTSPEANVPILLLYWIWRKELIDQNGVE